MKSIKKKMIVLSLVALFFVMLSFFYLSFSKKSGNNITVIRSTYSINVDDLRELVGDADYVFVGKVVSEDGTIYKYPVNKESEKGENVIYNPYTSFGISILENIKGNLTSEEVVTILKAGGVSKDQKSYLIYEGDEIPVVGEKYIFCAYAQPDGSLLVKGKNSNIRLYQENEGEMYKEILEAYNKQIITEERERFVSFYDKRKQDLDE